MELPTYTNIWKIEKRLYKLYDFRLPMPLPIGQVAAFLAIAIPYMLALTLVGMPFSHTWVWLYVLPPGAAAWLITRPVLEGKRLPELIVSHVRYLTEPRTWCRLAPMREQDSILIVARVWHAPAGPVHRPAAGPDETVAPQEVRAAPARPGWPDRQAAGEGAGRSAVVHLPVRVAATPAPAASALAVATPAAPEAAPAGASSADEARGPNLVPGSLAGARAGGGDGAAIWADAIAEADSVTETGAVAAAAAAVSVAEAVVAEADSSAAADVPGVPVPDGTEDAGSGEIEEEAATSVADSAQVAGGSVGAAASMAVRPVLRVRAEPGAGRPLHVVERALRNSRASWHDRVVVVPGGHRPGSPDHAQRDQARARLPLAGPARIVVLGTTAGAGQTVTTLLTGQLLASLRGEAVAVLDLGRRPGALTELARHVPRLLPGGLAGSQLPGGGATADDRKRGLQVVTADHNGPGPRDADRVIDAVVARYPITLADPAPSDVPRALQVADQLVLVTPAGTTSAASLAMTLEWLEAHGHGRLARTSVTVLNGASKQTAEDVERATTVASGRCRAIVRVPWDGNIAARGQLSTATVHAYTALAGVLVSALADPALSGSAGAGSSTR